jgi:hypothetical protein
MPYTSPNVSIKSYVKKRGHVLDVRITRPNHRKRKNPRIVQKGDALSKKEIVNDLALNDETSQIFPN